MGRRAQRWNGSAGAGLISVQIVDDSSAPVLPQTMEIECPGGAVIRLREDASAEVLERVLRVCQQVQIESACASGAVRSC